MRGGVGFLRELYKMPLADIYGRFREIPRLLRLGILVACRQ